MNNYSDNIKGIIFMVLSMVSFTLADMHLKLASETVTTGQIILVLGLGGTLAFWLLLKRKGQALFTQAILEPPVVMRTVGEILATIFIVLALTHTSFTNVTAIIQSLPLVITLAAYLFLGEKIGRHRLSAVILGFIGMLLIVRPGAEAFDVYSLLAVAAVFGMTLRDLGSRLAANHHSSVRLAAYGTLGQIAAGLGIMAMETKHTWPSTQASLFLLGLVVFASFGIVLITMAMRTGEVSAVTPFRYTRLVFGVAAGVLVFAERLDAYIVVGSVIILLCGLYIWQRERVLKTTF